MVAIWRVAALTALEIRRRRGVLAILFVYLIWLGVAWLLASVTMGSTAEIVADFGLAGLSLLGNLYAIFIAIQLTQDERNLRTLFVLLPRLPSRTVYVLGKFFGVAAVLLGLVAFMSLMLFALLGLLQWQTWGVLIAACFFTALEVCIAIALALLFANASSLFLAFFYTLAVDVAGRFSFVIKQFGESIGGATEWFTDAAYYLLPNLEAINLRNRVLDASPSVLSDAWFMGAYALNEIALILAIACVLFSYKDLQAE